MYLVCFWTFFFRMQAISKQLYITQFSKQGGVHMGLHVFRSKKIWFLISERSNGPKAEVQNFELSSSTSKYQNFVLQPLCSTLCIQLRSFLQVASDIPTFIQHHDRASCIQLRTFWTATCIHQRSFCTQCASNFVHSEHDVHPTSYILKHYVHPTSTFRKHVRNLTSCILNDSMPSQRKSQQKGVWW